MGRGGEGEREICRGIERGREGVGEGEGGERGERGGERDGEGRGGERGREREGEGGKERPYFFATNRTNVFKKFISILRIFYSYLKCLALKYASKVSS